MFKKILALVLALIMIMAVLAGCSAKKTNLGDDSSESTTKVTASTTLSDDDDTVDRNDDETDGKSNGDEDDSESTEAFSFETDTSVIVDDTSKYEHLTLEQLLQPENFEGSDIPDNRDYGGYQFHVLADSLISAGEFLDSSDGNIVHDAIINRQQWIEEYVGIDFVFTDLYGGYSDMEQFASEIEAASGAGNPYDLALAYNLIPPLVAAKGLSRDLAESDNLNLLETTKEYWGREIKQEIMVGGRIFWMSDNSSYPSFSKMLCIFVNNEFFSRKHMGMDKFDLYQMVYDGAWTMENMMLLAQDSYENTNTDIEGHDDGDTYGFLGTERGAWLDNWFFASGFRYTEINSRGTYAWTLDQQPIIDFIDWWQTQLNDDDVCKQDGTIYKMFSEGRAMFAYSDVAMIEQNLEIDFTILPLPIYKSSVKNSYSTPLTGGYTSWLIPKATKSDAFERSATVLELIAAEGNRRIAPVYFEIYLKRQNAGHDEHMQDMFNIIRNGMVFDLGVLYGASLRVANLSSGAFEEVFLAIRKIWSGNGSGAYSNISTVWPQIKGTAVSKLNNLMVDILDY